MPLQPLQYIPHYALCFLNDIDCGLPRLQVSVLLSVSLLVRLFSPVLYWLKTPGPDPSPKMQQAIRTENNQAKKTDKTSPVVKKHSGAAAAVKQAVRSG